MQVQVHKRVCRKCFADGIPFYAKRRKDRKNKVYVGHICILCWQEDAAIRNRKNYAKDPKAAIARVLKSRRKPENYKRYMKAKLAWSRKKHRKYGVDIYESLEGSCL